MALAFDEFGRPFILLREQESKSRLRGLDAQKANISSGKAVARILRTSLGPKGMDKMLQSPDGDVTISMFFLRFSLSLSLCVSIISIPFSHLLLDLWLMLLAHQIGVLLLLLYSFRFSQLFIYLFIFIFFKCVMRCVQHEARSIL